MSKDRVECVEVYIINDDSVEPDEEYFIIKLERSANLDSRITLENTQADIIITDIDSKCVLILNATILLLFFLRDKVWFDTHILYGV